MAKKVMVAVLLAVGLVPLTGAAAQADPVDTNVVERVECMFRVYVTEGGEQGLDCLT